MKQEDKNLLLKDLCARWPFGVKVKTEGDNEPYILLSVHPNKDIALIGMDMGGVYATSKAKIDIVKPYLRPMSSMTEEEAKEIAILHDIKDILSVKVTSDYIEVIVDDGVCSTEIRTIWYDEIVSSVKCFDFLTAHHFDYRGLIPKGLAIEITEENNPYKE